MTTAKARWQSLLTKRSAVLDRAREAASLTIPALMPPDGHSDASLLPTPYQSLGARGVNNLASKLLLALMPANASFFRLVIPDAVREEMGAAETDAQAVLASLEKRIAQKIETSNLRVSLFEAFKHLIVCGNGILYVPTKGDTQFFRLDQYLVARDADGQVIEIVIQESVSPATLSDEIKELLPKDAKPDEDVELYTWIVREGDKFKYHQEIADQQIESTKGTVPVEKSPWVVLRWQAVTGDAYGRSLVDEYLGDLNSLESLTKAIIQFSAVASKILLLLHPNSQTDEDALVNSESGDVIEGMLSDIDVLQLDKYADFQVAKNVVDDLTLRLSQAFLLQTGTIRNAERVTAEEVRLHAQELEDVLGGVYTVQSQELQLPLVRRLMAVMERAGELPKLPKGSVEPSIITGFEALGRGHELNKLRSFLSDIQNMAGGAALQYIKIDTALKQLATNYGVSGDLIKSQQEVAQEQAQANQAAMVANAAPGVAQEVAKSVTRNAGGN